MELQAVTTKEDIKKGDIVLIDDGSEVISETVDLVYRTEQDGVEIIFNKKKNKYFNLGMYLKGESWVKDLMVVKQDNES